jgi:indolepyruvate ferredoxin oxidoreductase beta subunit
MARLDRWFNKGRRMRTDSLRGYLMLHLLGGLKGWRRRTLRHARRWRIWTPGCRRHWPV